MRRWTINPVQLVRNIRQASQLAAAPADALRYLGWLYQGKLFVRPSPSGRRRISLKLPPPVGPLTISVRDNGGSDQLVFGEVMIQRDYEVDVPAPETVLDLGGNIGMATLYMARRWPRAKLATVEPMPHNLEILRQNLEWNGVASAVFPNAVGVRDEKVWMEFAQLDCASRVADTPTEGAKGISVDALSIPTMMQRLGWDRVGFLKMDIEGYEAHLLRGSPAWLDRVDSICLEAFDGTISEDECRALAASHGFSFEKLPSNLYLMKRPAEPK